HRGCLRLDTTNADGLENQLRRKLILSCQISRGYGSEGGIANVSIRRLVVHLVESVERLSAEVEAGCLVPQREGFMKAKVRLEESRGNYHIALSVTERATGNW